MSVDYKNAPSRILHPFNNYSQKNKGTTAGWCLAIGASVERKLRACIDIEPNV